MLKTLLTTVLCCVLSASLYAQKEANNWYFGNFSGVDFNSGTPQPLRGSQLSTPEGCAAISDKNGKLLFYTEGSTVWTSQHTKMPNGTGLIGTHSATQAALIVPKPGDPNLYYIFTIREYGGAMAYSVVDMTKNSGLGDVVLKNVMLIKNSTEKVTAVYHQNGKDVWVIGHSMDTNEFYCWLITSNGIPANPIINAIGSVHGVKNSGDDSLNARGYLKASPDGSKLALAVSVPGNFAEVFDFDNNNGAISNPKKLTGFAAFGPYGVEFSPNGKLLYLAEIQTNYFEDQVKLYQVPLPVTSGNIAGKGTAFDDVWGGALQLATDGKIYQATLSSTLNVVNNPDSLGIACNYRENGYNTIYGSSEIGLPGFIQSYFREHLSLNSIGNCTSDLTKFNISTDVTSIDSLVWDFGDMLSGKNNKSTQLSPVHQYAKAGTYNVKATLYYQGNSVSNTVKVIMVAGPTVNLGSDTTLYYGQNLTLNAINDKSTYQWSTGSTNATYIVNTPGTYSVQVTNVTGCSKADTIQVKYDQLINVGLKRDTSICEGQTINLDVTLNGATYLWSTGSTAPVISVNKSGIYWVEITNAYKTRTKRDTINVSYYTFNKINAVTDTIICGPAPITLKASGAKKTEKYSWYDENHNLITQTNGVYQTGILTANTTFYVCLTNGICSGEMHQINIYYNKVTAVVNQKNIVIDPGQSVALAGSGGKYYRWSPALYLSNPDIYNPVSRPVDDIIYTLTVTNESGCTDTTNVNIRVKKAVVVPNTFTPNNDGINDFWVISYIDRFPKSQINIYNRYGVLIKQFKNYSNNWDGTYNGHPVPAGTYYYTILLDEIHKQSGSVTIIR